MSLRAIALLALLLGSPTLGFPGEVARIGVNIPLTGAAADIGQYLLWGVEIAVAEANASGGVGGRPVQAVILDDETNPQKAAANVRQLIGRENVSAVLGPANSGNALAMIPIMQEARKPLMLLTASATKLTTLYSDAPQNYIFRATLPDREQIRKLLDWAAPRFPRLAIACDTTPYGQLARQDLTELMAERGLKPVAVVEFDLGELDMTGKIRELEKTPVDAVAVLSLGREVANFVRGADAVGFKPRLIGQYPFFLHPIKELPDRLSNGLTGVLGSSAQDSPKSREIDAIVRAKYRHQGYYPFKFVEAAYEGTRLVLQAMNEAGSDQGPAIRDALEHIERFQGVSQVFERPFSRERHELYKVENLSMGVWRNGDVVRLDQ
ncbi:MAG: ABC transporter substrate-binding protein [Acidobacteriota bacterium]